MNFVSNVFFEDGIEVVQLSCISSQLEVKIAVNIGNTLFSIKKQGTEYLYFPFKLVDYKVIIQLAGNPFMHPWANRLEGDCIKIDNITYPFPDEQGDLLYRDANKLPLHGLLLKSDKWKTKEIIVKENSIIHISIFDFNDADFLKIFPFPHIIEMQTELSENGVSINVVIKNVGLHKMPISFGFHPYFLREIHNNDSLQMSVPFENIIEVDEFMIPNGNKKNKQLVFVEFDHDDIFIANHFFDNGFCDINKDRIASFSNEKDNCKLDFGDYSFGQIYAPNSSEKPYICIEPMTAPTNALNTNDCTFVIPNNVVSKRFKIIIN